MDFNSLKDQVSNLSLYDLKAGVRKVQNAMMNYTEMESKVREATNNEPWGASSTLMQEIANGTHSYQLLNEIMPMIYKRFTEKTAEEWRQIYKALQLLEFLVKNGSERVVDDARSHISILRMLRQFHYIDQNGKDQGLNVRNRAQELAKLLGDVDAIRTERKKAKTNRTKFGGIEGGMSLGGVSSGSRFSGFGNDSYGGYNGGVYGDGGGFGGATADFQDAGRRNDRFEEYDENEDEGGYSSRRANPSPPTAKREAAKPAPPKAPEQDLFEFGDDEPAPAPAPATTSNAAGKQPAGNGLDILVAPNTADDDEFDDFQSAPSAPQTTAPQSQFSSIQPPNVTSTTSASTQFAAPQPVSGTQGTNLNGLVGLTSMTPTPSASSNASLSAAQTPGFGSMSQPAKPTAYQASQPNYFASVQAPQPQQSQPNRPAVSQSTSSFGASKPAATTGKAGGDAFGNLWSSASANAGIQTTSATQHKGPNLSSMAKEKASAGIWGAPATSTSTPAKSQQQSSGNGLDDLLG
ncbi:hypothetical protein AJ80_08330 [Polytolypa hystricis UAMH7299]|uniref:ENTH domain-containing protein n=1 Tax=Polytolypa hystricis (strain UAMH7299) TaxID=1447883 RepID=A0A2B7X9C9_POLH7|nr:hypothetical protein AJ80_08330 [Polytolypa hystricis UAMH7299]